MPDVLGVGDGVHWADGFNWRTTDGLRAAPQGGPGAGDTAIINKGDFGNILYDTQCSGTVGGVNLTAGTVELGTPMLTKELIMSGGSIIPDATNDPLLVDCGTGNSAWSGGSLGKSGGALATVNFFHGTVQVTRGENLYENMQIGNAGMQNGSASFKMIGASLTVGMSSNIWVDAGGTLYLTNSAPGAASSVLMADPALPVGGAMNGKVTVNGLMEVAHQWAAGLPQGASSSPIPILGAGSGQINVRHANSLSITGGPAMTFALDLQDSSSASVGLPLPGDNTIGDAGLGTYRRDTHVGAQAALHFFGEEDTWWSFSKASIDGTLDLGLFSTSAWHTHVEISQGSVWFNSSSHFLFWGSGSDSRVDEMWDRDARAIIRVFGGAVALPQVVPGTGAASFIWNDILEASDINGNFAVDPGAARGWRFFGSGAPGSGPHSPDLTWGFNTVSWNVAFNA